MDPNATWAELLRAYGDCDTEVFQHTAADLKAWLNKGGFPPRTTGLLNLDRVMALAVWSSKWLRCTVEVTSHDAL